jgi:VWFA-related protein
MPKVSRFQCLAAVLALLVVAPATSLYGQADAPPERSAPQSNDDTSTQDDQSRPLSTFKTGVDVVQLFFNVKDKRGALIPKLPKNDFQLLEDGKPQTIKYFSVNSDLPLTLGILIDASGSQQNVLDMEKQVGGAFLTDIIREKDLAFVLSFDVNVDLLQDFTSSTRKLKDALNSARINTGGGGGTIPGLGGGPIPTSGTPKGTLLYDAIYLAAHDELAQQVGRKAMIILTDGEDVGSRLRVQDAIEAAQKSDSIVYVLMIADRGFYGGMGYHGDSEMKKLSRETGGRVIDVGNKFDKLRDAFDQIALELRSQYSVGYTPTNTVRDGSFRKIEIHNKDYKIQARAGYYARPSE